MGETSSKYSLGTRITPPVEANKTAKGVRIAPDGSTSVGIPTPEGDFAVRLPRGEKKISITLNTRRIAEQRSIRRENEANRGGER
jgi:hypothetical protein